jgi:hypothetical protein
MYDDNENLNSVEKLKINFSKLALLFVSLFISCVVMFYVVTPMRKEAKIIKIGNEIKEESVENNNLSLIKIIKTNNESKEFDSENVKKIKEFISNRNNYEDYLIHIVKLANSKNIKIDDLSVNKSEDNPKKRNSSILNEMEINFAASSGFLNLISFLKSIERSIPFFQEESISISVEKKDDSVSEDVNVNNEANTDSTLDYEIKLRFYYY